MKADLMNNTICVKEPNFSENDIHTVNETLFSCNKLCFFALILFVLTLLSACNFYINFYASIIIKNNSILSNHSNITNSSIPTIQPLYECIVQNLTENCINMDYQGTAAFVAHPYRSLNHSTTSKYSQREMHNFTSDECPVSFLLAGGLCNQLIEFRIFWSYASNNNLYILPPTVSGRRDFDTEWIKSSWSYYSVNFFFDWDVMIKNMRQLGLRASWNIPSPYKIFDIIMVDPRSVDHFASCRNFHELNPQAKLHNETALIVMHANMAKRIDGPFKTLEQMFNMLSFNATIRRLSNNILKQLPDDFHFIHLRLEGDDTRNYKNVPRLLSLLSEQANRSIGISRVVYVAFGYTSPNTTTSTRIDSVLTQLRNNHQFTFKTKMDYDVFDEILTLEPEQTAIIDLLLAKEADVFFGCSRSTFTLTIFGLREDFPINKTMDWCIDT